jgi:hypothetical protein
MEETGNRSKGGGILKQIRNSGSAGLEPCTGEVALVCLKAHNGEVTEPSDIENENIKTPVYRAVAGLAVDRNGRGR